jgi:hypothetical protein
MYIAFIPTRITVINNRQKPVLWYSPVIPAHRRLKQENHEFKASLGYIVRPCQKKNKTKTITTKRCTITSAEKDVRKLELSYTADVKWCHFFGKVW